MSRIFAVVAVVLVLGAGALAVDYAYDAADPADADEEALQDDLVSLHADALHVGSFMILAVVVALALAAVRVAGG